MGSHHSHEKNGNEGANGSGTSTPRGGSRRGTVAVPRSESGGDIQEKPAPTSLLPVEKLGKILAQRSQKEDGVNGVTEKIFVKYVFPGYPELGSRLYQHLSRSSKAKNAHMPAAAFRQQCERLLAMLDDANIVETYVRMFSPSEDNTVDPEGFRELLKTCYKLSMDHYPEGPQHCFLMEKVLSAVVAGCCGGKSSPGAGQAVRWLLHHCPRLILPLHRYCVHVLTTLHRSIDGPRSTQASTELTLSTPVLERERAAADALLPVSCAWLVAAAAHPLYTQPTAQPNPGGISSSLWVSRLACLVPSHWTLLYDSRQHGCAANRFLHHVTAYRGPSVLALQAEDLVAVITCPQEWRESLSYWGSEHTALMQLFPQFEVIDRGARLLYLNTTGRGTKGLRCGSDRQHPHLEVDEDFEWVRWGESRRPLERSEVWGCGDERQRHAQLDVKKWQIKEAERQSKVKLSAADWIEHPDRYLLELAGRPQYNNSAS